MQFPELWTDNCADLLRAFNNQGVQYLLIGSMAKSHYCRQLRVNDIDLMINPTPENAGKVLFCSAGCGECCRSGKADRRERARTG